jgi:hypothetical protein
MVGKGIWKLVYSLIYVANALRTFEDNFRIPNLGQKLFMAMIGITQIVSTNVVFVLSIHG